MSIGDTLSDTHANLQHELEGYSDRMVLLPEILQARVKVALSMLDTVRQQVDKYEIDGFTNTQHAVPTRFYVEVDPDKYKDGGAMVRTYLTQHTRSVALD